MENVRGRPPGSKDKAPRKPREDYSLPQEATEPKTMIISRYIRNARNNVNLPPIDIANPKEIEKRINYYLDECERTEVSPTISGLCNCIGINRRTLTRWESGDTRKETHMEIALKYKKMLEEIWETELTEGKINPIVGFFIGKNHYGYTDKTDISIETDKAEPLGNKGKTIEQLAEEYKTAAINTLDKGEDEQ